MNIEQNKEEITETQSDFNMEAATAEISADLFGQDESGESTENPTEGEGKAGSTESESSVEQPTSPQTSEETNAKAEETGGEQTATEEKANSEAVQDTGAPKTWTKEALEHWATIPPRAQAEILKREEDFMRGITQYKSAADLGVRYSQVVEPYAPMLAAENIDPVGLFQSFAANHYLLSRGTPEQKLNLAAQLITGYGIDFGQLASFIGENAIAPADPEIVALRKEINELKSGFTSQKTAEAAKTQETIQREVDTFASDTAAHPYFNEVVGEMMNFMKSGSAQSLQEAYDMAVYANPVTRQKEVDRLIADKNSAAAAEEQARKDKIAASTAANVKADPHNRNGTEPLGTMDETLEKTLAAIQARG
jgi:hypothetical protein